MQKLIMTILDVDTFKIRYLYVSVLSIFMLISCNSNKPIRPMTVLKSPEPMEETYTDENIPVEFVEIKMDTLKIVNQMVYATDQNFLHKKVYPCARAFLRVEPYIALIRANEICRKRNLRLVLFDAYRPISIQKIMYDIVQNPDYVAPPEKGSKHNRGCAVDIGLADESGILDFGTEFDDFSEKAHFHSKEVSDIAQKNRQTLREIMIEAGFTSYDKEWWHFNYKKTDYPTSDFVWKCKK